MKKRKINYLDFEVDKLTRSIENVITGDSFQTEVSNLLKSDLKQITRKHGWRFDWAKELGFNDREVYKLTIEKNPSVIQGLISLKIEKDHIYLPLIESAPYNIGKGKTYFGVPGNLVAFACKVSLQKGYDGYVSFHSKTKLIDHYEKSLGAYHFGGHLMIINDKVAKSLVDRYYKS